MIDPFFGTALGVAGSLLGSLFSKKSSDKQLRMQVAENQKNRDFNAEQADIQREFITKQIADQNAYNSPSAVVERLKSAGLNPNLAYQQIGAGQQISNFQGSSASSSGSVGAGLPDFSGFNSLMQAAQVASNIELQKSQADKNSADAENTRIDTKTKEINNSYLPQILKGQISLQGSQLQLNTSELNLNSAELRKIDAEISQIDANIDQIRATVQGLNLSNEQMAKALPYVIREVAARADISEKQAKYYVAGVLSQIGMQNSISALNYSQAELNEIHSRFLPMVLSQQLYEINSRIKVNQEQADLYHNQAERTQFETSFISDQNWVYNREHAFYHNMTTNQARIFSMIDWAFGNVPFVK